MKVSFVAFAVVAATMAACVTDPPPPPRPPPGTITPAPPTCNYARPACAGTPMTYADVLPVLKRGCFACHAADGMAADDHDFTKPAVAIAQKSRIAVQVGACTMPPRQVPLAPADAQTLMMWATCGDEK